MTAEESPANE